MSKRSAAPVPADRRPRRGRPARPQPSITAELRERAATVRALQSAAEEQRCAAAEVARAFVRELISAGFTVRAIGDLLGVSGMRVSALANTPDGGGMTGGG